MLVFWLKKCPFFARFLVKLNPFEELFTLQHAPLFPPPPSFLPTCHCMASLPGNSSRVEAAVVETSRRTRKTSMAGSERYLVSPELFYKHLLLINILMALFLQAFITSLRPNRQS